MNRAAAFRRVDPFAVASFLLPLSIYLLTLAPSVTFFDSGEFLTAIASLGTAHSPGYPLFINYAHPFTWLPFGSIAFRVNCATAVSAALACYGVYLLTSCFLKDQELPGFESFGRVARRFIPLCAALTFAWTPRLWLQSNHDKPYPLLAFLCALVFYLMLLWRDSCRAGAERPSYVYLGAFLCGLGTGAHQTMVLMIPSFALLLVAQEPRVVFRVKEILLSLAFGLLGFGIHLHMVVRALQKPLLNWGDPKDLEQFLWNLLRKGYPTEKPARDLDLLWAQVNAFSVPFEFTFVGVLLLVLGLAWCARKQWELVLAYVAGVLCFLLVIVGYFNTPFELIFLTEEFFTPLYLLSAVFIGVGLFAVLHGFATWLPAAWTGTTPLTGVALLALFFTLPLAVCLLNYRENDQHENYIAFDYASNSLRSLPQDAVMYTWGDSGAFPLWYLQGVERLREDVDLPHTPHLVFPWYLDSMPRMFATTDIRKLPPEQLSAENALVVSMWEQFARRPVFIDFSTRYSVTLSDFTLQQRGICYRLARQDAPPAPPESAIWQLYALRGILGESGMFFRDLDTEKAILIYASARVEAGESLFRLGQGEQAVAELEAARQIAPQYSPQVTEVLHKYGVQ